MIEWKIGGFVKSKSGHDKGCFYIIIEANASYLYLADGKTKTLDKLKKKNIKHVQYLSYQDEVLQNKINHNITLRNEDIQRAIKSYQMSDINQEGSQHV